MRNKAYVLRQNNLQKYRKWKGYTQLQLVELTKVSINTVILIEKMKSNPNKNTVKKIMKAFPDINQERIFPEEE